MAEWRMGTITKWNDEKGYGFVAAPDGRADVYFHITGVDNRRRRPVVGEAVVYLVGADEHGRPRALRVHYGSSPPSSSVANSLLAAGVFLAALVGLHLLGRLPIWLPLVYVGGSLITFFAYGEDKKKAERGQWRTSESGLHTLEFFGGWPGALVAQQFFRHKNRKTSYQIEYWMIVILHCVGLTAYCYATPNWFH